MTKNITLLWLLLAFSFISKAQTPLFKSRIAIDKDQHQIRAYIYPDKIKKVKPRKQVFYHYYYQKEIHQTQGGYTGYLLHGNYEVTNDVNQMIQQGQFKNGLKNGEWKEWQGNGTLGAISQWKKGRQHGKLKVYDSNGKLSNTQRYRNGKAKGERTVFQNGKKVKKPKAKKEKEKEKTVKKANGKQKKEKKKEANKK